MMYRRWSGLIVLVIAGIVGLIGMTQAVKIHDWFRLRNYEPPAAIVAISDQTTMTSLGRHLFYINHPRLDDKQSFRTNCPDYEATIVLGCYRHGQGGIHILQVDDPRLEGIEQVTAAHEMLHAAYDRLSSKDKTYIDGLLEEYAVNRLDDQRIKETIKDYERTQPGTRANEIHSIFGTEIATLTPEIEEYYRRFFTDRQAVVGLASQYQEAFSSRQDQVKAYDQRLAAMNQQVKSNNNELISRRESLLRQEAQLESLRENQIESYNAGVAGYNQAVAEYNELLERTKALIEEYNSIVEARNEIAVQTVELQKAIDSEELPASQ